ncbi:MutS-related protein [Flavonifractor hominis]|uniref:DNA mismatch repair protein MutS n=1 Tax=Flavonifractor hominis TaxID=3133178 RepID=A0ABV1EQL1_9FIRM
MELTHELRENAGFQWVLERLSPLSPFGKQAARNPRWYGPGDEEELEQELDNVALAMELWAAGGTASQQTESCCCETPRLDASARKDAAAALRGVTRCLPLFHDIRGSFDRDPGAPFDLVELFEIKHFLVTMEQVNQAYAAMPALAGITFPSLSDALELMDPEGRRLPTFSIVNSYHNDLAPLRAEKAKLEKAIRMTQEEKRGPLLEKRRVLAVQEDQLELEVRVMLTGKLMAWREDFLACMQALGHLDLIVAKAKLALRFQCVRPTLSEDGSIELHEVIHPQVAEDLAARGEQFTSLDLHLHRGCTVITGANMGGKTVSLRATVLSLLLCQCGFFVFARAARLPLFHRVELILADSGPGSGGLSSFGREVHLLDQLLCKTRGQFFFVALDEFARGTNPQEGAALARALVRHLGTLDCVALMTTHYDGVSDVAGAHYQVAGLVRDIQGDEGDDPRKRIARRMDYHLLPAPPGAPCPRDALRVCRLLKLDEALMELFQADL